MKFILTTLINFWVMFVIAQNTLNNSSWFAHTKIPRPGDIQLVFRKDSFLIYSDNGNIIESMTFSLNGDKLDLHKLSGRTPCPSGTNGSYKILWSDNGEKFSFENFNDSCKARVNLFTNLQLTGRNRESPEKKFYRGLTDSTIGINLYTAYELLKGRKSQTVIVGLIGNFDVDHEDLKGLAWTNTKEIPNNGIDDDKNGYVDDIRGWNFMCDKNGNSVPRLQKDVTYIYKFWKDKYDNADPNKLKTQEKEEFDLYQKAKKEWEENYQYVPAYKLIRKDSVGFFDALRKIADKTSYDGISWANFVAFDPGSNEMMKAAHKALQGKFFPPRENIIFRNFIQNFPQRWPAFINYIDRFVDFYDLDYDPLKMIGDDPHNMTEHNYGSPIFNEFTTEMSVDHDTHIVGIIAANRNNGIGTDGIADNVKILCARAGVGGDERDKDVANAIRYAVDNGAKVLNLSFGKRYSSHKQVVDEAIRYAAAHDVLVVHAAGNDGENCDSVNFFPQTKFKDGTLAKNVIQVGSSRITLDSHLPAYYSNYGKQTVDLFAPGDNSYGPFVNNHYGYASGTSNAAPFVVGVAALLKSYFPELSMLQIRQIILETTYKPNIEVIRPHYVDPSLQPQRLAVLRNQGTLVSFSSLSVTGGILDAGAAVKRAMEITGNKSRGQ